METIQIYKRILRPDVWQGEGFGRSQPTNDLEEHIKRSMFEWLEHVIRMAKTRVTKKKKCF
jgi:hypothetical protein